MLKRNNYLLKVLSKILFNDPINNNSPNVKTIQFYEILFVEDL